MSLPCPISAKIVAGSEKCKALRKSSAMCRTCYRPQKAKEGKK